MSLSALISCSGGGSGDKASASASGTTTPAAALASLVAKKPVVTSGQAIQLAVSFSSGTGNIQGYGAVTSGQTVEIVSPAVTAATTVLYTLDVTHTDGSKQSAESHVSVVPSPSIRSFGVVPGHPTSARVVAPLGQVAASMVSVAASDSASAQASVVVTATATILYGDQAVVTPEYDAGTGTIDGIGPVTSGVSYPVSPLSDQTYVLRVVNGAGDVTTANADVHVIQPTISAISPQSVVLSGGRTQTFSGAVVAGAIDGTIRWSTTAGSIDANGNFQAPTTPGAVTITAQSVAKASVVQIATVTVVGTPLIAGGSNGLAVDLLNPPFGRQVVLNASFAGGSGVLTDDLGHLQAVTSPVVYTSVAGITQPTTYTLAVTNELNETARASVMVTPHVVTVAPLSPRPTVVSVGDSVRFASSTTGAADPGLVWTATGGSIQNGLWVAPQMPGQVTINAASKSDGSKSASVVVSVVDAPVASAMTPSAYSVGAGGSTTITPVFSGGSGVVDQGIGTVVSGAPFQTGPLMANKTFTLTVTNPSGATATNSATISVQSSSVAAVIPAAPTVTAGASIPFTAGGATSGISWAATGGSWGDNVWTAPAAPGSYLITGSLTVDGTKSASTSVTVVAAPVITSFGAGSATITAGTITTLTAVYAGGVGTVDGGVGPVATGAVTPVSPTGTTTYTLTVTNAAGTKVTAAAPVAVVAAPQATNLGASTLTPAFGASFTLTASYLNGVGTLDNGLVCPPSGVATGAVVVNWVGPRVYTLSVRNAAGVVATKPLTVTPQVVSLGGILPADVTRTVSTATTFSLPVAGGALNSVSWSATGGSWLGNTWTAPAAPGTYTLTATSTDDPSKTISTTVTVVALPSISGFAAGAPTITAGTGTTLTAVYAGGVGAVDLAVGPVASAAVTAVAPTGTTTYTLTVTNAAGTAVTATALVTVIPAPVATGLLAAVNPVAYGGTTSVTPVFSAGVGMVDQGVGTVTPGVSFSSGTITATKTFNLTVTNAVGATATTAVTLTPQAVGVGVVAPLNPTRTVGTTTAFSAAVSGSFSSALTWSSTGGTWSGSTWTAPATPGTYMVTAASMDDPTKTSTSTVTVVAAPGQPAVTAPGTVTAGRSGYVASVPAQAGVTHSWMLSAGTITGGHGSESITWTAPGVSGAITVSCTTQNAAGTTSAAGIASVNVVAAPVAPTITAPAYVTASQGGAGASIVGQPGSTYVWGITNGLITGGQGSVAIVFTPSASGSVALTCSVTNAEGVSSANGTASSTVVAAPVAGSLIPTKTSITLGGTTLITPTFSGGVAKIGTSGVGSSDLTAAAVSGVPVSSGVLSIAKTFTLTVTNQAGSSVSASCTVGAVVGATASISASTTSPLFAATNVTVIPTFVDAVSASVGTTQGGSEVSLWPATGVALPVQPGGFTATQVYWLRATNSAGDNVDSQVTVTPQTVVVTPVAPLDPILTAGTMTTFSCSSTGGASSSFAWKGIAWSATGGAWNGNNWTAPLVPGSYVITAKSVDDTTKFNISTVNVVPAPVIISFNTSSVIITAGSSVNLTAVFTGGTASVDNGVGAITSGVAKGVTPAATTTYTLSVTNAAGTVTQANVTVTVVAVPTASSLVATLNPVPFNGTTVLTPVFAGGVGVVDQGIGTATTGVPFNSGVIIVPRIFTLTVTNAAGATATASVTVAPQAVTVGAISPATPFVTVGYAKSFSVSVTGGATNTVTWSSTGGSWSGSSWTAPGSTGTYTITATSVDDPTKTSSTTVTVVPMPVASGITTTNANPLYASSLTLTPTYSLGVGTIDNGVICPATGTATNTIVTNWNGARTYTLTVANAAGATAMASVVVVGQTVVMTGLNPATPIRTISTSTLFSTVVTGGLTNNVIWSSTGGSWSGATWTAPATPGNYTVTATSVDDPSKVVNTVVTVVALPVATGLTTTNANPLFAATVTLTPAFSGGTGAIGYNGLNSTEIAANATSGLGIATAPITVGRTYTLTVTNAAGTTAMKTVVVTPQTVVMEDLNPAMPTKTAGSTTVFSTVVSGGATNAVNWSSTGGSWSGATWTAPGSTGTYTITGTSADDPTKSASTTVTVVAAPSIGSFVYGTSPITVGSSTTVTPTFSNGTGVVDNGVGVVTSGGAKTVTPGSTTTYTLTVTNAAGTQVQATVAVTVVAVPIASSLTASSTNPLYASTFTLTPTYSNGVGTINNGVTCPASGSASSAQAVNWTGGRNYILTVTNVAGTAVTTNVVVTPQVVNVGALSPGSPTRSVSTPTTFTTVVTGGFTNNVNWSSTGGSWSGNTWTAPAGAGSYTITATSVADPSKSNSTVVTVVPLPIASGLSASTTNPNYNSAFTLTPVYSNGVGTINYGVACPGSGSASGGVTANWGGGVARTFILTVTNAAGATATASAIVTPQTVSVGAISPGSPYVTVGHTKSFTTAVSGGATNGVTWSSTGGGWAGNTWTAPGVGTYTITATSNDDPSRVATTTANVVAAPVATSLVPWTNPVGSGSNTNITPNFSGGSGFVDQGVGGVSNGSAFNSGNLASARTYTLTVTNLANDTATTAVTVNVMSVSVGVPSPTNGYVTAGYTKAFSAVVSGGALNTVSWWASGGSWAGSTWTAPGPGTYTITATSNDDGSKTNSTLAYVVAAPTASISASSTSPLYGAAVTVTPSFVGSSALVGTGGYGSNNISNGASSGSPIGVSGTTAYTYYLRSYNLAGLTADSAVTVTPQTVSISKGVGSTSMNASTSASFSANVGGAANGNVNWSANGGGFSAGVTGSGVTTSWTAPATGGNYTVTATSAGDGSKSVSWSVTVSALPPPVMYSFGLGSNSGSDSSCEEMLGYFHYFTTYFMEASGLWDSAVLTDPIGSETVLGVNGAFSLNLGSSDSGSPGGYCQFTPGDNTNHGWDGLWTLRATRNGQELTWTYTLSGW